MKRSEAIELICSIYNETAYQDYEMDKETANKILTALENKKMLPPSIKNPRLPADINKWDHATQKAIHELYNTKVEIEPFEVNEWESEDEDDSN